MKKTILCTAVTALGLTASSYAAISIVANNTTNVTISSGGANWDTTTFPPSSNANVYWDANTNGTFGEAGENTGNVQGTLSFTINPITSGTAYHFGMEGFGTAGATGTITFTITNTDATTQLVNVVQGTTTNFSDSNGDQWQANFVFNNGGYGDVVFNGGTGGNGANVNDHQGILTFTAVPEPSSTTLIGLGGLALILRRRK